MRRDPAPLAGLELHTGDLASARALYAAVCGWEAGGPQLGGDLRGAIVENGSQRSLWLPYVRSEDVEAATDRARVAGAEVLLEPGAGPTGFRSVIATRAGAQRALWQPNRR